MVISKKDKSIFEKKYNKIKGNLSFISRQMIETMYMFIQEDTEMKQRCFQKDDVMLALSNLNFSINIQLNNNIYEPLRDDYIELENMIANNEPYFDLLIRLQCAIGSLPNEFFQNRATRMFYFDIMFKIVNDCYEDKYSRKNIAKSKIKRK